MSVQYFSVVHFYNNVYIQYKFILIDVGGARRQSEGTFSNSTFGQDLEGGYLSMPGPEPLPGTSSPDLPYVIVGNETFPLHSYLLRPYPSCHLPGNNIFTIIHCIDTIFYPLLSTHRGSGCFQSSQYTWYTCGQVSALYFLWISSFNITILPSLLLIDG